MENITIGQAISGVQELYSKGSKSRSSRLSSRYIYSLLKKNRATVLRQQINKKQSVSQWNYQPLNCIELESVEQPHTGKILLRTVNIIPVPILGLNNSTLTDITSIDGDIKFDLTTLNTSKYNSGKKYTSTKPTVYMDGQRIHINSFSKLKGISLRGLFYDPIEAIKFSSLCSDCTDCDCKDVMEFTFPIDGDTLNTVNKLCKDDLILFLQMKEDKTNNANDDIAMGNQMVHQQQQQNQGED